MEQKKNHNIEIFLVFLPFLILAFSGTISSNAIVFLCFGVQIISLIGIYFVEKRLRVTHIWKTILSFVIVAYIMSVICSILGYSPFNSIRVTTMVYLNILLLGINISSVSLNNHRIFNGFIRWCWILSCISVAFSLLGILIGSGFQVLIRDGNVIILSNVRIGPFTINQYAVQGGLINGNLGVASWFTNPNIFSMICLVAYTYCLYNKKTIWVPVPLIGIVLGYSRAILIMTVVITFLFIYQTASNWLKVCLTFGAAIAIGAILFWGSLRFLDLNGRQNMWRVLLDYSVKHYFLPSGLGTSSIILKDYGGINLSAHSLYINVLVEYGLIVTLIIIVLITKTLRRLSWMLSCTTVDNDRNNYKMQIAVFVSLLLLGFTEVTAFTFSFFNYLFFFVIFTAFGGEVKNDNNIYADV